MVINLESDLMGLDDLLKRDRLFHLGKNFIAGNVLFLTVSVGLLLFFLFNGLADVYKGLPVAKWIEASLKYLQGVPVSDIVKYTDTEKLLTEAEKIPPVDILTSAEQFFALIVSLIKALIDEIFGIALLVFAFALKLLNHYFGKPGALVPWLLIALSPVAAIINFLSKPN